MKNIIFLFLCLLFSCRDSSDHKIIQVLPNEDFPTISLDNEYDLIPDISTAITFKATNILPGDMLGVKKEKHRIYFPILELSNNLYKITVPTDFNSSIYDVYILRNGCERKLGKIQIRILKSITLAKSNLQTKPGKTVPLQLIVIYTNGESSSYDIEKNPMNLTFHSNAPDFATIDNSANITGVAEGSATVLCKMPDNTILASANVEILSPTGSTTGITKPLSEEMIFSKKASPRWTTSVMQSFDIDSKKEKIYYSQLRTNYRVYISRSEPSSTSTDNMAVWYTGHGSNIAIEEENNETYIWINNYGSKNADGEYWRSQTVARIPYTPGELEVRPEEITDNYYLGASWNGLSPAIDVKNDMLAIYANLTYHIYRLSEAKALPMETIQLSELTYGGGSSGELEVTEKPVIQAHNLTKLSPIGVFKVEQTWDHWQGFDIDDGKIYQFDGGGGRNDGTPGSAALTVFDLQGNIVEERTSVAAISDVQQLAALGITVSGYMEAEGVKVHDGILYLGFASKSIDDGDKRRSNIFRFQPAL